MKVSVFTPTFNRGYILGNLYDSLKNQTSCDFEWIIVDDGSTDHTRELVESILQEKSPFPISYYYQTNGGKHTAINKGVQYAHGEWFFVVDSDDYLSNDAIETIIKDAKSIESDNSLTGLAYNRAYFNGEVIGGAVDYEQLDCSLLDYRYKYKVRGDKAEIYKTAIFKLYSFPVIEGEKFCTEAMVCNRIALKYKLRYINKSIYYCEYLSDGLSAASIKSRMRSCKTAKMYYQELFSMPIPTLYKIKAAINYIRFALCDYPLDCFVKKTLFGRGISCFVFPIALALHIRDLIKTK